MTKTLAIALFALGVCPSVGAESTLPLFRLDQSTLSTSRQLLVVVTDSWKSVEGRLWRFDRKDQAASWTQRERPWRIVVGRNGMAWGIGNHGGPPPKAARVKREGDGCAPAGIFSLVEAFGKRSTRSAKVTQFPYRQLSPTMRGIDDPRSRYYNRIVDQAQLGKPDWQRAESMLRKDPFYDWGIVVAHNWKPFPARGSCIFLHTWKGPTVGTAGCTAMPEKRMISLVRWLESEKNPRFVQFPSLVYRSLKPNARLPELRTE